MTILDLKINGYKCFNNSTIKLNNLTILTGANASGKSSIIQSLLLLKIGSENTKNTSIPLVDNRYALDLGFPDSIINNELESDEVIISLDDCSLSFIGGEQKSERKLMVHLKDSRRMQNILQGFTYLCAERQGPRYEYEKGNDADNSCGCHGENTGNIIANEWNTRIDTKRVFNKDTKEDNLFKIQMDSWVDYIFPGIALRIQPTGSNNYQVLVNDRFHNVMTYASNVGFGISYALPIIVESLLVKENGWFVVENPEAHLHAKAQSNMGYFLGVMAASGIRMIIETHSEHVVNGIRRAATTGTNLNPKDVNVYFFKNKSDYDLITIDDEGNLSDFPVDFFDQSRQDLLEIINSKRKNEPR